MLSRPGRYIHRLNLICPYLSEVEQYCEPWGASGGLYELWYDLHDDNCRSGRLLLPRPLTLRYFYAHGSCCLLRIRILNLNRRGEGYSFTSVFFLIWARFHFQPTAVTTLFITLFKYLDQDFYHSLSLVSGPWISRCLWPSRLQPVISSSPRHPQAEPSVKKHTN